MTPPVETPERFRDALGASLVAQAATLPERPAVFPRRRPVRPRLALPAAALVAALVAATVAGVLIGVGGGGSGVAPLPAPASAAAVLRRAASALERSDSLPALSAGQYRYTKLLETTRYTQFAPDPYVVSSTDEIWVGLDGTGRDRYQVLGAQLLTAHGATSLRVPSHRLPFLADTDERLSPSARPFRLSIAPSVAISYRELLAFPTAPAPLAHRIDTILRGLHPDTFAALGLTPGQARAAGTFLILRGLAEAPAPAPLLAGLLRVLARTPGLELLGPAVDAAHRHGTEVAVGVGTIRLAMILDPSTGALLQTSRTLLRRGTQFPGAPGLLNQATYVGQAVTASTHSSR